MAEHQVPIHAAPDSRTAAERLFAGPGEMRARCRGFDWATTPLGRAEHWSPALRAAVAVVLDHGLPMALIWGQEQVAIYNDACRPLLGEKHPTMLGRSLGDTWPEVRRGQGPLLRRLLAGEAVNLRDVHYDAARLGASEDAWYDVTLSPVRDETGVVAGALFTVMETTERVHAERALRVGEARQAFLVRLGDALRPLANVEAVKTTASRILAERLGANRVLYLETDGEQWLAEGLFEEGVPPQRTDVLALQGYGRRLADSLTGRRRMVSPDIQRDSTFTPAEREEYLALGIGAAVAEPLVKEGRVVAILVVHTGAPRQWSDEDIAVVEETAERTWAAVERARAELALREIESRFRAVADLVPDLLWESEADGSTRWYNARWHEYTGATPQQTSKWGWLEAIHPDDRDRTAESYRRAAAQNEPFVQEQRIRGRDGAYRWFLVHTRPLADESGRIVRWIGAATDIHAQRMALDEAERLAGERLAERDMLRRQLLEAEEAERGRLARELHDQAGQILTALGLGLKALSGMVPSGSEVDQRAAQLLSLVSTMGQELHGVAVRLRPRALDDFGLEAALSVLAEECSRQLGAPIDFHVDLKSERLPSVIESAVYRIVQEALTNVARHSGATRASLVVERRDGHVVAVVEDDGRGFDPAARPAGQRFGLVGMRERVALLAGSMDVESTPGGPGTTLFVRIPLEPPRPRRADLAERGAVTSLRAEGE